MGWGWSENGLGDGLGMAWGQSGDGLGMARTLWHPEHVRNAELSPHLMLRFRSPGVGVHATERPSTGKLALWLSEVVLQTLLFHTF